MKFQPGQSGNPAGKPKGCGHRQRWHGIIASRLEQTILAMQEAAEGGDVAAGKMLLQFELAPMKEEPVSLPLEGSPADQARQILVAAGNGDITPSQSNSLMQSLLGMVRVIESSELESRIAALEHPQSTAEDLYNYVPTPITAP